MGGVIAESIGMRSIFYLIVAIGGVATALGVPLLRETHTPVIRLRHDKMVPDG